MLKKAAGWIILLVFRISVSLAITLVALSATLGSPDHIKNLLNDSGIYGSAVDGLLTQVARESKHEDREGLALEDPKLREVTAKAFTPELLKSGTESFIDGFYGWLSGTADDLSFSIDLTQAKEDLAGGVAEYAGQRLKSLPACQPGEITRDYDPLTADCRPPVNIQAEQKKLAKELATSDELLGDTKITEEDLPKGGDGEPFAEANADWPDKFRLAKSLPLWLGLGGLILGGSYVLLNQNRKTGIKRLARTILAICAMLVISTLIFLFIFNRVKLIDIPHQAFQESLTMLFKDLALSFAKVVFIWSIALSAISAVALLVLRKTKPKAKA